MKGWVDDNGRALIDVQVGRERDGSNATVTAWIDTAFDGHLVFPHEAITELNLETLAECEAVLADGSIVTLETYLCYVDWFGNRMPLQVIANNGRLPLQGTGMLDHRVLHIDYGQQSLSLD